MMCARSVMRSINALQSRAFGRPRVRRGCKTVASKFGICLVVARQRDSHAGVEGNAAVSSETFRIHWVAAKRHDVLATSGCRDHELEAEGKRFSFVVGPCDRHPRAKFRLQVFLEHVSGFQNVRVTVDKSVAVLHRNVPMRIVVSLDTEYSGEFTFQNPPSSATDTRANSIGCQRAGRSNQMRPIRL